MDFDAAKENIQPLACGRNAEQLEVALIAESDTEYQEKLLEQRKEFERAIECYDGDDALQPWYDYIVWVEQSYPKSGKESAWYELVTKCLAKFENDPRYFQDRRMLKLYIKYIDCEPNPPEFYEQLYNNGIGTMIADLYLCWAHYFDYCDNFEKAESVYRKGLDARAQPLDQLEQAHKQFGFSMSQRLLYKDDVKRQEFRSSMEEKRLALTSLRAHKHKHVGSIRTGSAVKSHNPGRVQQPGGSGLSENRKVQIFDDSRADPKSPTSSGAASTSVVQTILKSTKKQENLREPGPWSNAKMKSKPLFTGAPSSASQKLAFSILEDDDRIPSSDEENNYARGIQLPPGFARSNLPQKDDFDIPIHRDDEIHKSRLYKYDKFMVFPSEKMSFSLDELKAYKWFKENKVENGFTRIQAKIWENGYGIPIRIPPDFKRKNHSQTDDMELSQFDPKAIASGRKFSFKIDLIYTSNEEYSPEEILQAKWINGDLRSQKDTDMELTVAFERREDVYKEEIKRRSMALGGRKSILPRIESPRTSLAPKKSVTHRKSIATIMPIEQPKETGEPPSITIIPEPTERAEPEIKNDEPQASTSNAARKVSLSKRKSVYDPKVNGALETIPESFSPPVSRRKIDGEAVVEVPKTQSFNIFQDEEAGGNDDKNIFRAPQIAPAKPQASAFQEEDDCNTQMFNFFIQSQQISTPKVSKSQSLLGKSNGELPPRKELDYGDDNDSSMHEVNEEPEWKQPLAGRSSDIAHQYTFNEPNEMYRQKLSAIMELTEEPTISSSGATTSSKSSNDDFDFTRNQQSTTRSTALLPKTSSMSRAANLSKINEVPAIFEHTLPPAAQFCVYEDEKELTSGGKQSSNEKDESTIVGNESNTYTAPAAGNKSILKYDSDATLPNISKLDTERTANISQLPANQSKNRTLEPKLLQKNTSVMIASDVTACDPSMFKIPPEETVTTQFVMNFAEEKTEKLPDVFHTREISFKAPLVMEEPQSIYIPKIPEEMTLNIPPLNGSVFEMPREPTMPILPKSPTKEDPNEITTNFSIFEPFGLDKTTADTDLIAPKVDIPEKPVFEIYQDDTGLVFNKSKQMNLGDISKKIPVQNNSKFPFALDDAIEAPEGNLNEEKENMKMTKSFYATVNQTRSHKDVDDELWEMIKSSDQSRNAVESSAAPIANKSISRKSIKPSVDDELYAMLNSPPATLSKTQSMESNSNKSIVQLRNKSTVRADETVTMDQVASVSSVILKSELHSIGKSELPLDSSVTNRTSKPKSNIDDDLYAMINSPEPRIFSVQNQSIKMRESIVQQQSKLDAPSLLEPMKEMSISEYQKNKTMNISHENGFAMSEEIPNTALFSLNMASIKNSTIVGEALNELRSDSIHIKSEQSSLKYIRPTTQPENETIPEEDESEDLDISGIELTEKEMDLLGNKNRSKFNQTTSAAASNAPEATDTFPQFQMSAPVSIRPSQFQPNDTKLTESFNQTASRYHMNASKLPRPSIFNKDRRESRFEGSIIVVEDIEDSSVQIHTKRLNSSKKDSIVSSPFKNHYETNPRLNETLGALKEQIDPFDIHLQNAFLDDIDFHEYIQNLEHVVIATRLGAIESDTDVVFQDKSFHILKQVGKGSFGFVYSGQCKATGKLYAFKQERPANLWEFYISLEIASRVVDPKMLPCFLSIDYALIGTNSSIFVSEYCQYGSLFDICNRHKENTCRNLDEIIAMILSDQMLSILDHLHASHIIHGDIKPDNLLLVKKLSYGTNELSIKLIDYGRSIDLNFLPPKQTFTTILNTNNFICTEMMDGRPWKYQIDLFCMASTIYTLICGKYMNVKKQCGSKLRPYVLSERLPSYLEVQMWENILYPLINVQDCNTTPDLQKLRLQIREVVASKERFVRDKINKFNAILDA